MRILIFVLAIVLAASQARAQSKNPSFEEVISLRSVGNPVISPDGKLVAFTMRAADWDANQFDSEIWISKDGKEAFPATRSAKGSSASPVFSPDSKWLGFLSDREGRIKFI